MGSGAPPSLSNTPFVIVATQIDLRDDKMALVKQLAKGKWTKMVSTREGKRLARETGATKYVECSSLTQTRLEIVLNEAVTTASSKWPIEYTLNDACSLSFCRP
ncbi:hypothetical protein R3P38DRAFT_170624 [Favolaschia claudopus]|uniref:Uncharacterized protein n=1 Tax=Favolaschia claudopus TaxID=2862362 RepID=A0AAW0CZE8_9AGAR